jgi:hypothetical protein
MDLRPLTTISECRVFLLSVPGDGTVTTVFSIFQKVTRREDGCIGAQSIFTSLSASL